MKDIPKHTKRMNRILDDAHEMAQKKYDDPASRLMFELVHAAIALAAEDGRERSRVARALGISKDTLNDRLCGRPDRSFRFEDLARMMFDPGVLGKTAQAWTLEQLAIRAGRRFLMPLNDEPVEDLMREGHQLMDSVGFASSTILSVTDPNSEGGAAITPGEARKVMASVGGVMSEVGDMLIVGARLIDQDEAQGVVA